MIEKPKFTSIQDHPDPDYDVKVHIKVFDTHILHEEFGTATYEDKKLGLSKTADHYIKARYYYKDVKHLRIHRIWETPEKFSIRLGMMGCILGDEIIANQIFEFINDKIING